MRGCAAVRSLLTGPGRYCPLGVCISKRADLHRTWPLCAAITRGWRPGRASACCRSGPLLAGPCASNPPTMQRTAAGELAMFDYVRWTTLHPALVHLPLGLLPLAVLAYWVAQRRQLERWQFVGD